MQPEAFPSPLAFLSSALWRHKSLAILFFVTVLGITALATYLMPRSYRSRAKLLLRLGRENATLDPTATMGQSSVVAVPFSRDNEINSIIEILTSRILLEQVIDSVGPAAVLGYGPPAPLDRSRRSEETPAPLQLQLDDRYRAILQLSKKLEVEAVKKSNVIAISYEGPSRKSVRPW